MERETKEIITPGGRKVIINSYFTDGETTKIITQDKFKSITPGSMSSVSISLGAEFDNEIAKTCVVSIDGQTENIVETISNLPVSEARFIKNACTQVWSLGFTTAKQS